MGRHHLLIINIMKFYIIFFLFIIGVSPFFCNNKQKIEYLKSSETNRFLTELALIYWDYNYKFPTSYLQTRDTQICYSLQYKTIDSILLYHVSEIKYTDQDTALLITYYDDTLALVDLPCSCDYSDEIPYGPRAYDSINNLILDDFIQVDENGYLEHITFDLVNNIYPIIEKEMISTKYKKVYGKNRKYPPYLLVEYQKNADSIHLIKACEKYSFYYYEEYANILRRVLSEYCKKKHISRLLIPVEIYIRQK